MKLRRYTKAFAAMFTTYIGAVANGADPYSAGIIIAAVATGLATWLLPNKGYEYDDRHYN